MIKNAESNELYSDMLYVSKANLYLQTNDFEIACEAYQKALDFGVDDEVTRDKILICELLSTEDDLTDKVIEVTQNIENEKNSDIKALKFLILGIWNYKGKKLDRAEEFLRKAANFGEQPPFCYHLLAKIYVEFGDEYRAQKYFELALDKNSRNFDAYKDYVDFLFQNKRYEDVKYKSKNALKIFVNNY